MYRSNKQVYNYTKKDRCKKRKKGGGDEGVYIHTHIYT